MRQIICNSEEVQKLLESKDWYDVNYSYFKIDSVKRTIHFRTNNFIKARWDDNKKINTTKGVEKLFNLILEIVFEPVYLGKFDTIIMTYTKKDTYNDIDCGILYRKAYKIFINEALQIRLKPYNGLISYLDYEQSRVIKTEKF